MRPPSLAREAAMPLGCSMDGPLCPRAMRPSATIMLITVFHAFNSGGILAAERVCSPSAWKRLCEPYIVHTRYVASSYVHELAPIDPGRNPRGVRPRCTLRSVGER